MVDKADDAVAMWQQMIGEMQKGFRAFSNQLSAAPVSRDALDQKPSASSAQKQMAEFMESYFEGLNLPSRAQLNGMSDRLQAIESELTEIKALLHEALTNSKRGDADSSAPNPSAPDPSGSRPRPKRPASAKSQPRREPGPAAEGETPAPRDGKKRSR